MKRAVAHLPLHTGAAPAWLFGRMWKLAGAMIMAVAAATVRSLSLLAGLIYGAAASHRDPADKSVNQQKSGRQWADYSYAHGGKDAHPFPVDRRTYDQNVAILSDAWHKVRLRMGIEAVES